MSHQDWISFTILVTSAGVDNPLSFAASHLRCQNWCLSGNITARQVIEPEAALSTRACPPGGQTQHSAYCKVQSTYSISHPTIWLMCRAVKAASVPVSTFGCAALLPQSLHFLPSWCMKPFFTPMVEGSLQRPSLSR